MYYHETASLEDAREYFKNRLSDITIPNDIDQGIMMNVNSALDELYTDVCADFSYWKTKYDIIKGKINQVEKGECAVGSNTENRRARAINVAKSIPVEYFDELKVPRTYDPYTYEGETYNLYTLCDECTRWFNLYEWILDAINFKSQRLIIVASALKIEGMLR